MFFKYGNKTRQHCGQNKKHFNQQKKKEGVKIASKYKLIYETLTGMQTKRLLNKILLFSFSCIFFRKSYRKSETRLLSFHLNFMRQETIQ